MTQTQCMGAAFEIVMRCMSEQGKSAVEFFEIPE